MTHAKSKDLTIHLINPLSNGEYTLCGEAEWSEENPWEVTPFQSVTCKNCLEVVDFCKAAKIKIKPSKIFVFTDKKVPVKTKGQFKKNGWIAPNGDFYGCEIAEHYKIACWIYVFILNGDKPVNTSELILRENNWVAIKNSSDWLERNMDYNDEDYEIMCARVTKIFRPKVTSPEQEATIQKYLDYFEIDLDKS